MKKEIDKHAKKANEILEQIFNQYLDKEIVLLFSGGVDCLWIQSILRKINHKNVRIAHFYPKEIDPFKIRDYKNVLKFQKETGLKVEFYSYPLF